MMVPPELHEKAVALSTEHGMSIGSEGFNPWVEYRIVDEQGGEQIEAEAGENASVGDSTFLPLRSKVLSVSDPGVIAGVLRREPLGL